MNPIPVTPETLPDDKVVDFVRYAIRKHVAEQNEHDTLATLQRALDRLGDDGEAA